MISLMVKKFWSSEFIRFLVVGGCNILLGYIITIIIFKLLNTWGIESNFMLTKRLSIDLPLLISTTVGIPIAYTAQTLIAFRETWSFKRLLVYPVTILPNLLTQQIVFYLVYVWLGDMLSLFVKTCLSYALATIAPIPIMFILVRLIVKNKKS